MLQRLKAGAVHFKESMGEQLLGYIGLPSDEVGKDDRGNNQGALLHSTNKNNNNNYAVRAVSAKEPIIYDISFDSIYDAYLDCRKNKRTSNSCTLFDFDYEFELVALWNSIRTAQYKPSFSYCFIVSSPVYREVFAASFIDRVVHHWIALRIEPIIEHRFVEQGNVSKNCRKGQGSKSAISHLDTMIKDASNNYTEDCYIFKGDFTNFFMSMDKALMWEMVQLFVLDNYHGEDLQCLLYLLRETINNCPQDNCVLRSPRSFWDNLPKRKSLFHTPKSKGLPIGNLSSQLLANFYASCFDEWMTEVKGVKHYIRFVDDFVFILPHKEDILTLIPEIKQYLSEQLLTELHPNKIYVQHYSHGVPFVGAVVKPGRIYISNRTRSHFYNKIRIYNSYAEQGLQTQYVEKFVQSINSYLGLMIHYNTYRIRKKICSELILPQWHQYLYFVNGYRYARVKVQYRTHRKARQRAKENTAFI